jgi:hypothetical protein
VQTRQHSTAISTLMLALLSACSPTVPSSHPASSPASPVAAEGAVAEVTRSFQTDVPAPAQAAPNHMDHAGHTHNPTRVVYVCPMHPEVTSDKADSRCSKCGMNLVEKK